MNRINIFILINIICVICSCSKVANKVNLDVIKEQDFVVDKNKKEILLGDISDIVEYQGDKFILIDGSEKEIYLVDNEFTVLKNISLKSMDYLFTGSIFSATLRKNNLYIIDNSFTIKILDLNTEQFSLLPYKIQANAFSAYINSIKFVDDSSFICTALLTQILKQKKELSFGARYNLKGELISSFSIPLEKLDYNSFSLNSGQAVENCFVSIYKNNIYFSFWISKKVLKYDLNGKLLHIYTLEVDKNYWQPPQKTEFGIRSIDVNYYPLEIKDNKIFQVVLTGEGISPSIYEYDMNFIKQREYIPCDNSITGYRYMLKYFDGKFLIKDIPGPLFYLLKPTN